MTTPHASTITTARTGFSAPPSLAAPLEDPPPAGSGAPVIPPPRRRRKPAWIALGIALVVLGALGAVYAINQVSARVSVVGVATAVPFGQVVRQTDLVPVQLPADPALRPVPWSQVGALVGKRAATDLRVGSLLTTDSVAEQDVPPKGKNLLGVPAKANQLPATPLKSRDQVLLVAYSGGAGTGGPTAGGEANKTFPAEVFTVRGADANGVSVVDVLVADGQGAEVAQKSAAGQIAIVLLPRQ